MRYLKTYESNKQFREVNIQDLWNDFVKYKKNSIITDIMSNSKYSNMSILDGTILKFQNELLKPILKGKKVEFHKGHHKYTDEETFGFDGIIDDVNTGKRAVSSFAIYVNLTNYKYILILCSIDTTNNADSNIKQICKIYDSEETEIENEINLLKNTKKYNL